ncbi:CesD/SycD/LcrH family type III secretion system chaperone, partial [Pseudomonas sp. MWU12-2115]
AAALKWCASKPEHAAIKAEVLRQAALLPQEEHA